MFSPKKLDSSKNIKKQSLNLNRIAIKKPLFTDFEKKARFLLFFID